MILRGNAVHCQIPGCDYNHVPNIPLLRKVYEHISNHPMEWNQGHWGSVQLSDNLWSELLNAKSTDSSKYLDDSKLTAKFNNSLGTGECGTVACFAGWAVQFTDHKYVVPYYIGSSGKAALDTVWVNGEAYPVSDVAVHELGLIDGETDLFGGANSLKDIRKYCEEIAARAGETF